MSEVTCSGRTFTRQEIELMREIARDYAGLGVTEIARTICELLDWKRPGGGLKNHECRLLLERLRDHGQLTLPAVRALGGRGSRRIPVVTPVNQVTPPSPITGPATGFRDLALRLVDGVADSRVWRECVEQHHYLGCPVPYGAHLRYWIEHQGQRLGCLLWTSPAWRMKPRDEWIGWSDQQRRENLQRIVNNGRFLILPWVKVAGLASMVLAGRRCKGRGAIGQMPLRDRRHRSKQPTSGRAIQRFGSCRQPCAEMLPKDSRRCAATPLAIASPVGSTWNSAGQYPDGV